MGTGRNHFNGADFRRQRKRSKDPRRCGTYGREIFGRARRAREFAY